MMAFKRSPSFHKLRRLHQTSCENGLNDVGLDNGNDFVIHRHSASAYSSRCSSVMGMRMSGLGTLSDWEDDLESKIGFGRDNVKMKAELEISLQKLRSLVDRAVSPTATLPTLPETESPQQTCVKTTKNSRVGDNADRKKDNRCAGGSDGNELGLQEVSTNRDACHVSSCCPLDSNKTQSSSRCRLTDGDTDETRILGMATSTPATPAEETVCKTSDESEEYRTSKAEVTSEQSSSSTASSGMCEDVDGKSLDETQEFHGCKTKEEENLAKRVFVGNIAFRVTTRELWDFFSKFGQVLDVHLVKDNITKKSKGIGFVKFVKAEAAEKARNAPQEELLLYGRDLRVAAAVEKRRRKMQKEADACFAARRTGQASPLESEPRNPRSSQEVEYSAEDDRIGSLPRHINQLPAEMLEHIFSNLKLTERIALERVCKQWRNINLTSWSSPTTLEFAHVFSVAKESILDDHLLKSVLRRCGPSLKQLDLSTALHRLSVDSIAIIADFCPNLEFVNLSGMPVTNIGIKELSSKCLKLKNVIIPKCYNMGEKGLWWLLKNCQDLEYLDVSGNQRITGSCFRILGNKVKILILNDCCKVSSDGVKHLHEKQLTALQLNNCGNITVDDLSLLMTKSIGLKSIHIDGRFTEGSPSQLSHRLSGTAYELEELSAQHNKMVDDAILEDISRSCSKLRKLNVSATFVTDAGLRYLHRLENLTVLRISYMENVTDAALEFLAMYGRLQVVEARGCFNVTDTGCRAVAAHCLQLTEIDICSCIKITNATIEAVAEAQMLNEKPHKVKIIVGGTSVNLDLLTFDLSLLEISDFNLCPTYLQPDRIDYFDMYEDEDTSDDDENIDLGGLGYPPYGRMTRDNLEDFLEFDDPSAPYDNEWQD